MYTYVSYTYICTPRPPNWSTVMHFTNCSPDHFFRNPSGTYPTDFALWETQSACVYIYVHECICICIHICIHIYLPIYIYNYVYTTHRTVIHHEEEVIGALKTVVQCHNKGVVDCRKDLALRQTSFQLLSKIINNTISNSSTVSQ